MSYLKISYLSHQEIVRERLAFIDDGREPDPAWGRHQASILNNTLQREAEHVRARSGGLGPPHNSQHLQDLVQKLRILNGDPRIPFPQHYCSGCCTSREDCVHKIVAAIVESGMLCNNGTGLPAKARWGSMTISISKQVCGIMTHGILPQAIRLAFNKWEAGDPGEEEDDEHRALVRGKAHRAKCVLSDDETS